MERGYLIAEILLINIRAIAGAEVLNGTEWANMLITNTDDQSAAMNIAQLLGFMLQGKCVT